ncbi:type I-E CRISPR-associated protein Cas6/Cse3/CasE [Selenomonas ruminantium]|uniref:CRISPR-associated protein, Cse3 family n=1 Tax=Selenomonas ruminantium TaxID=971 RepID=A0A1I0VS84_SELRU|nr:type I-E CRISPR-associated protein Cas6/Cse3/CasE [Selenomonas ruminantium]SFA79078.1 CRISPR-associated protein, Cse3 family [Selenomonas ruminantium]
MYLSKLHLDIRSPYTKKCLHDCQIMHRSIQRMFDSDRQSSGVLYRLNPQRLNVYVWSAKEPDKEEIPAGMQLIGCRDFTDIEQRIYEGQCYRFNLLAVPSKKVAKEGKKNSQRRFLYSLEEQVEWLQRKGEQNGFSILQVQQERECMTRGKHTQKGEDNICYKGVVFQGVLQVNHAEMFKKCWQEGIGPGKAYGQGMLILTNV